MNTILRSLIVWIVLLAVPFQGFASAAMLACGPGHAAPATVPVPDAGQMHDGAAHGAAHGMSHDMSGHDHAAMAQAVQDDAPEHDSAHACSACSACSIGAAIAPAVPPALPVHAAPLLSIPFADGHVPSVDLALPERPPRPFCA
ncbi:hypothetical protein [Massilia niabensis]|uniref:DUF2946 domain-containing protein n=1 Tax=Massilia niabensis TaxID=544910 RepID=A0ABW0KZM3_9BURK